MVDRAGNKPDTSTQRLEPPICGANPHGCGPRQSAPKVQNSIVSTHFAQLLFNQPAVCATLAKRRVVDRNHKIRAHQGQLTQDPR